jgi:hypothetical protein
MADTPPTLSLLQRLGTNNPRRDNVGSDASNGAGSHRAHGRLIEQQVARSRAIAQIKAEARRRHRVQAEAEAAEAAEFAEFGQLADEE